MRQNLSIRSSLLVLGFVLLTAAIAQALNPTVGTNARIERAAVPASAATLSNANYRIVDSRIGAPIRRYTTTISQSRVVEWHEY